MKIASDHPEQETQSADGRRRHIRAVHMIFAGAATIATLALLNMAQPGAAETAIASGSVQLADSGFATDDPSDPGFAPQPDPGDFPTNPGWSSQSDPGWNADPGWDFQPSPEN
jgi:hypothetical protein